MANNMWWSRLGWIPEFRPRHDHHTFGEPRGLPSIHFEGRNWRNQVGFSILGLTSETLPVSWYVLLPSSHLPFPKPSPNSVPNCPTKASQERASVKVVIINNRCLLHMHYGSYSFHTVPSFSVESAPSHLFVCWGFLIGHLIRKLNPDKLINGILKKWELPYSKALTKETGNP